MKLPSLNNLTDLAELLRSINNEDDAELGFDMSLVYSERKSTDHPCGSACCIGGWVQACNPETREGSIEDAVQTIAPEISLEEIERLCFPDEDEAWIATPEDAARAVEILRDTGKCDWHDAMDDF